ncbi:MAG TPA: GTPase [Candidatus Limivicinus faecipullorum]|nr:GTPase [Candidatus Limivicinus faecipullorum]
MLSNRKDVPVYLFTGFLEGGKTKFIQETLEDRRFCNGEKTLLLVCEEGEEEYAPEQFASDTVQIRVVEDQDSLTRENLEKWLAETRAERVVVEYNGMWMLDVLYNAMPEGWMVYQEFMFADSATFLSYNSNMRQLVYDKLKSAELVVFNRFDEKTMDKMAFHKIVRGASRRADIAYEAKNGKVVYDDIEDPLPFDLNAPIVEIGDDDFALFYRDMADEPKKYDGKTVRFKCRALVRKKLPANCFVVGRHVMTCCVEDIQFAALVCQWDKADTVKDDSWMILTAKVNFKFHRAYNRRGPVLSYISAESCEAPEQPVATFY